MRKKNLYRLVLSVEMLGKAAAVEVDAFLVEKINNKRPGHSGSGRNALLVYSGAQSRRPDAAG